MSVQRQPAAYYELRLYKMWATRMPDFHDLLGVQVPPLFARNGIPKPLAFWESYSGRLAPLFAYIIPWESIDERMAAWTRFYADPVWVEKLAANYGGEQRVEHPHVHILRASPLWSSFSVTGEPVPVPGLHEMRIYSFSGLPADGLAAAGKDLGFLAEHGAQVLGLFETWIGMPRGRTVAFLAWENEARRRAAYRDDGSWEEHGTGQGFGDVDIHVMKPISYGIPLTGLAPR